MIPACIKLGIYDRAIVARLMQEAGRRNCRPEQLALALISCGIEMPDAVLDGAEPAAMHPHAMPMARTTGLTVKQRALLALAVERAGDDGLVKLTARAAADGLSEKDHGAIMARFRALVRYGFLDLVGEGPRRTGRVYRVSARARTVIGGGEA